MNRRDAIVGGLCVLLLKPLTAVAGWFKKEETTQLSHDELSDNMLDNDKHVDVHGYFNDPEHVASKADLSGLEIFWSRENWLR